MYHLLAKDKLNKMSNISYYIRSDDLIKVVSSTEFCEQHGRDF